MVMHITIPDEKSRPLLPPDVEVTRMKKRDFKLSVPTLDESVLDRKYRTKKRFFTLFMLVMILFVCIVSGINFMLARELYQQKQENQQLKAIEKMMALQEMENLFPFPNPFANTFFGNSASVDSSFQDRNEVIIFSFNEELPAPAANSNNP